jgi:hypothetical protein
MDIVEYFENISRGLKTLVKDAEVMANNIEKPKEEKRSLKSMQPMTRIRKDKGEIEKAKANPEITFIEDTLKDIFKG